MLFLFADKALTTTIVAIVVWVIVFPVLVQGLIVYAVIQARGEKRANEELRRRREA
jgi:NhaP-type Na+/H+ or K+/H+ antiporter